MAIFTPFPQDNYFKKRSSQELFKRLKYFEQYQYDLARRLAAFNLIAEKTLLQKFKRQLLIYQIGYYFALYEHLYNIYMQKEKQQLIKDRPGMKVLFDEGIVKDIKDVISLREKAKNRPSNPP